MAINALDPCLLCAPALPSKPECPPTPLDDLIARGKDRHLGLLRGTVESPE